MDNSTLVDELLALSDPSAQKERLAQALLSLDDAATDALAEALKKAFDTLLRRDLHDASQSLALLDFLVEQTSNPFHKALALRARGNWHLIGQGEPEEAIRCYDQAAEIYGSHGRPLDQAGALVGKVGALANLGRFKEAKEVYEWASHILSTHGRWIPLAIMSLNLAMSYQRLGDDARGLQMAERAGELFHQADSEGKPFIPWVENNRAIYLRNLGRFEDSLAASQRAYHLLTELGQPVSAARAQQTTARTYFVLGRYNEGLNIFNQVREQFMADDRLHDAMLLEVDCSDLLLEVGRFGDVLQKCQQIRELLAGRAKHVAVNRAILNEGLAYTGLRRYAEARASLAEARILFDKQDSESWVAMTELATATILYQQKQFEPSLSSASACANLFERHNLSIKQAQAQLLAARAAKALHQHQLARQLVNQALQIGQRHEIPFITYQSHHLWGSLLEAEGEWASAIEAYQLAIQELEQLRGRVMIEYRSDFLANKQSVYEDLVRLALDSGKLLLALQMAERAKSRALLDLLAYRLDLTLTPRSSTDSPLIDKMMQLRAERDQLYRRWESRQVWRENLEVPEEEWAQVQQAIVSKEKEITEKWHTLLIRNADYARDAALWQVRTEEIQPYLAKETLLIEYFVTHGQLVAFLITSESIQVRRLPSKLSQIRGLWNMLRLNLNTVPRSAPHQIPRLAAKARASSLRQLERLLIAPLRDALSDYPELIIVPHSFLHYLPFHAFYDGQQYLLEQHQISYLPSASVLRYTPKPTAKEMISFGYSHDGHLPARVEEALAMASIMQGEAFVEEEVTLQHIRQMAPKSRILHLATHGYFHQDNPLFSGLMLADGYLTTLEAFNLRLNASLVTLSGCQTGQSAIRGGDELLGLMRAFLYAGTASLVLTHWVVEDRSTALLMQLFYQKLAAGWTKGAALRFAQRQMINPSAEMSDNYHEMYAHPYFWASCFMVGDTGKL